jgi:hypothetical protein
MQIGRQLAPAMWETAQKLAQFWFIPPDAHGLGGSVCVIVWGTKGFPVPPPVGVPAAEAVACLFSKTTSPEDRLAIGGSDGTKAGFDP